jgi:Tropinone reductase 1
MDERWSLKGKRAVVTGGTKGIGRATADIMLDFGATVLVVAREPRDVEATRQIWKEERVDGDAVVVDVTSDEGRAALAREVTTRWGAVDILANNVGAGLRKPFVDYDLLGK